MRRLGLSAAIAVALIVATQAPALAAGGTILKLSEKGDGADAVWTTCPKAPPPPSGATCTFTDLSAATQLSSDPSNSGSGVFFHTETDQIDGNGNWQFVSSSQGTGPATVSVDPRLTTASVTGSVALLNCDATGCVNGGTVSVTASWTGSGTITRGSGMIRTTSPGFVEIDKYSGTSRAGTATATVGASSLGTSTYGDLFTQSSRSLQITH